MSPEPNRYFSEIEELVDALAGLGFPLVRYSEEPRAFNNFYADFSNGSVCFRVIRDRSQFMVDGEKRTLELSGLWKAFDNQSTFEQALLKWVREKA
jgi:hypothetical protein